MSRQQRIVLISLIIVWAIFFVAQPARASNLFYGEKLANDQVINHNVIFTGTNITVDGTVNGDVFAIGNTVTVNGSVQGNLFLAGQSIILNGQSDGNVYAVSVNIVMAPSAVISQNLTYAGISMDIQQGAQIGRDLYVAALGAQFSGKVDRNTQAIIGLLEFVKLFTQNVDLEGLLSPPAQPAPEGGSNSFAPQDANTGVVLASFIPVASQGDLTNRSELPVKMNDRLSAHRMQTSSGVDTARLSEWAIEQLRQLTIYLTMGLIIAWRLPKLLDDWSSAAREKPLPAAGFGLLAAINGFVITVVVFTSFTLVGFWLGSINLWELTYILWGIGYSAAGLGFAIFMLFFSYGSKIVVAYLVSLLILKRILPRAAENKAITLLLGLVLYVLLRSIPTLGWVIAVLATIIGLGAIWLVYRRRWLPDTKAEPVT